MVRLGIGNLKEKLEEGTQLAKLYTVNSASVIHGRILIANFYIYRTNY